MMNTYNLSEFRSFQTARQIAWVVIMLLAFTLTGSPRLWGQCALITNISTSATPSTVVDGTPTEIVLTFTLNTPVTPCNTYGYDAYEIVWVGTCPNGQMVFSGDTWLYLGQTTVQGRKGEGRKGVRYPFLPAETLYLASGVPERA